ncbi:hypothetical protein ACQCT5_12690 [Sutcliffiella halmapala]
MFFFLRKMQKVNNRGLAKLMFQDVSDDSWDQRNLTKENLDFSLNSLDYMNQYIDNLLNTKRGQELLDKHFSNFVLRIGAYFGEVVKEHTVNSFHWYEYDTIFSHTTKLDEYGDQIIDQDVLYDKKREVVILPLYEVQLFLKGQSRYERLSLFVEDMIEKYKRNNFHHSP